ncbi:high-potential iron-sulfur protein [Noviherbaspirillum massiliense]|uniref:high-potential iron-sulfur protein n=1 Tax=Noviherbaspirillum massiliense TaxID=1465823 RepID=UPI00030D351D|nr:high-potential iron-sulfur protein [Noviherbaspirillum massiliense]
MQKQRRKVLRSISTIAVVSAAGIPVSAFSQQQLKKIDPKDPQAVSLGYVDDTKTVDSKKYPKHDNSQVCSGCQFYTTAQEQKNIAPCTIFGGKAVAANGWCSAYVKKAS